MRQSLGPCWLAFVVALGLPAPAVGAEKLGPVVALDEITVSARRREETLQDVPIAVTAFSAEALDRVAVRDLGDLDALVPNLTAYAARGSSSTLTAYVRGIGQSDPLWGVDPGVGVYLDDVYIARPQGALLDVFDVERIEVLRGPQGTLYGKNTVGGAIRYLSAPLEADAYGSTVLAAGSRAQFDLKTSYNLPLAESGWSARIALASLSRDGFGRNRITHQPVSDKEILATRLTLGHIDEAEAAFSARLSLDALDDRSAVRGARMLAPNRFAPAFAPLDSRYDVRNGLANVNDTRMHGAALHLRWRLDEAWQLKSISAVRSSQTDTRIDFDTTSLPILDSIPHYADHQRSQELQLNYDAGAALSAVAGLYAFDGEARGRVHGIFHGQTFNSTEGAVRTESIAVYGEATLDFASRWSAAAGLRYTHETKRARIGNFGFTDASFVTRNGVVAADFSGSKSFGALSPRLSIDYSIDADRLLYALVSRGFKSGGFNIRANTVAVPESARPFDDERLICYELGIKGAFLARRLFLNLAAFHNDYRDIQLSVNSAYDSNGDGVADAFFGDFTNAGRGAGDGLEIEYQWQAAPRWRVFGHLAALHTRYLDYLDRGVNVARQRRFTNAPELSGAIHLQFEPVERLEARLSYSYQSAVYPTTDLSEAIRQDGYGLLSAGLYWQTRGAWRFALEGSNLTDRHYRTTGYSLPTFGVLTGFYGAPRTLTLSIGVDY